MLPGASDGVQIIGAGPAGLAAAIAVSRAGGRAVVYERQPEVGARFHGDFQGLENWTTRGDIFEELASFGIEPTFEYEACREGIFFDSRGREFRLRASQPVFYVVRRGAEEGTLDRGLKQQALEAGVDLRLGRPWREHPLRSIVATGPRQTDAIDVGYVFETRMPDGVFGAFSDDLAPRGYAYLIIWRGRGTLASCLFGDFQNEKTYRERTLEFFDRRIGLRISNARPFAGAGNMAWPRSGCRNGALLVGEAAGFQDALWGFGLRFAMVSGCLAARALLGGWPSEYDRLWKRRFRGLMRSAFVNRLICEIAGERSYGLLLRSLSASRDARERLRRFYAPSLWKTTMFTLGARCRRLRSRARFGASR
jgi:flavin-dependent dehydrogenase